MKNFKCIGCGLCCRQDGRVWLNNDDIEAAAKSLGITSDKFKRDFTEYFLFKGRALVKDGEECCFILNDNRCKIYEARPKQCREYPFWKHVIKDREEWDHLAGFCEGVRRFGNK